MTSKTLQESVTVVHLVRNGNPEHFFQRFMSSYLHHPAGMAHLLMFVLKGYDDHEVEELSQKISRLVPSASVIPIDDRGFDITAYRVAAGVAQTEFIAFLNSHAVIEADRWLEKLMRPFLEIPSTGITGATGNWESLDDTTPFPNVHIRTNGFAIRRSDFLSLGAMPLDSKLACNRFEAGIDGLTRQLLDRGMEPYVVDKHGTILAKDDWPHSHTFRSGDQELLLISDNRTRQYQRGSERHRMKIAKRSWGDRALVKPLSLTRRVNALFRRIFALPRS